MYRHHWSSSYGSEVYDCELVRQFPLDRPRGEHDRRSIWSIPYGKIAEDFQLSSLLLGLERIFFFNLTFLFFLNPTLKSIKYLHTIIFDIKNSDMNLHVTTKKKNFKFLPNSSPQWEHFFFPETLSIFSCESTLFWVWFVFCGCITYCFWISSWLVGCSSLK